jgi:hypothetical protein
LLFELLANGTPHVAKDRNGAQPRGKVHCGQVPFPRTRSQHQGPGCRGRAGKKKVMAISFPWLVPSLSYKPGGSPSPSCPFSWVPIVFSHLLTGFSLAVTLLAASWHSLDQTQAYSTQSRVTLPSTPDTVPETTARPTLSPPSSDSWEQKGPKKSTSDAHKQPPTLRSSHRLRLIFTDPQLLPKNLLCE